MKCKDAENMIPLFLEDDLDTEDLREFMEHINKCEECKEELTIQFLVLEGLARLEAGNVFDLKSELELRMEEAVHALGDRMFLENNPFDAVRGHSEWNGLRKIRELLAQNQADGKRNEINIQAEGILKDPRILAAAVAANRRVLAPLWRELLEEGIRDGSIHTEYVKELSELLPLLNFWFLPSVFPASAEEICHKYRFAAELLSAAGLPILEGETAAFAEDVIERLSRREE